MQFEGFDYQLTPQRLVTALRLAAAAGAHTVTSCMLSQTSAAYVAQASRAANRLKFTWLLKLLHFLNLIFSP